MSAKKKRNGQQKVKNNDLPNLNDSTNEQDFQEETAAEVAPRLKQTTVSPSDNRANTSADWINEDRDDLVETETGGMALGWTALVLSIVALFFMPVLLGTVGAVTGFFAYRNGARTLGTWAIGVGIFAIILGAFFIPFILA